MAVTIKVPNRTATPDEAPAPPKPKRSTTGTAKRGPAKGAPTPVKRGPGRPRKNPVADEAPVRKAPKPSLSGRRSSAPQTDDKTMKRLLDAVAKAGARRKKAEAEHKASVDALHTVAKAALDGGCPMGRVSESSGISRQWLYKMGEHAGRDNGGNGSGNGEAVVAAAVKSTPTKRTQSKRPAAKAAPARKSTQSKKPVIRSK